MSTIRKTLIIDATSSSYISEKCLSKIYVRFIRTYLLEKRRCSQNLQKLPQQFVAVLEGQFLQILLSNLFVEYVLKKQTLAH